MVNRYEFPVVGETIQPNSPSVERLYVETEYCPTSIPFSNKIEVISGSFSFSVSSELIEFSFFYISGRE